MRKYMPVLLAAMAVLMAGAVMTSGASALEWLVGGVAVKAGETVAVHSEGEILLEDMGAGPTDMLCSGFLDGIVEEKGFDLIEKMLDLSGTLESKIPCSFILPGSCESGMAPLLAPDNLPWLTELFDDTGTGLILDLILTDGSGNPGWGLECLVLGLSFTDLCEFETSAEVENDAGAGNVKAMFSHTDELVTPPGACTVGGAKTGLVGSEDETGVVVPSRILTISGATLSFG
jgi:hypothetical protein